MTFKQIALHQKGIYPIWDIKIVAEVVKENSFKPTYSVNVEDHSRYLINVLSYLKLINLQIYNSLSYIDFQPYVTEVELD